MLLEKGHHMEISSRYRQHVTCWQEPRPDEDVDDAVHEAFNRMRNEMGKQFFPAQLEAFQAYRAWEALQPQMIPQEAAHQALSDRVTTQIARAVRWVSLPWLVPLADRRATAADIPPQEHAFYLDDGKIKVICEWWAAYQNRPATLRLRWQADFTRRGNLWARFTRRDDLMVVLIEIPLGRALEGDERFTAPKLGFDPTQTPWALTLLLTEPQA